MHPVKAKRRSLRVSCGAQVLRTPPHAAEELDLLSALVAGRISQMEFKDVAVTLWGLAKMCKLSKQTVRPGLLDALLVRAKDVAGTASPRHVSNTLWACATLGLQASDSVMKELVAALTRRMLASLDSFGAQAVTNILWAFASLHIQPTHQLERALLHRATHVLPDSSAQGVANMIWSLGTLSLEPPADLLDALHRRAAVTASHMTPQGIALYLKGHAALGIVPSALGTEAILAACRDKSRRMTSHQLAQSLWSLASLAKRRPFHLLDGRELMKEGSDRQGEAKEAASAGVVGGRHVEASVKADLVSDELAASSPPATPRPALDLANHRDDAWFDRHGGRQCVEALTESAIECAHKLDAQEASMVMWATATLAPLMQLSAPTPAAQALHAAALRHRNLGLRDRLTRRLISRLLQHLGGVWPALSSQDVATCYWSLAFLGVTPVFFSPILFYRLFYLSGFRCGC